MQYNGAASSWGFLTIAATKPAMPCTSSVTCSIVSGSPACCATSPKIQDLSFIGSANVPDVLDLLVVSNTDISRDNFIGAQDSNVFCMACGSGGMMSNIGLSQGAVDGYTSYNTPNGMVFDGYGTGSAANKLVISNINAASCPEQQLISEPMQPLSSLRIASYQGISTISRSKADQALSLITVYLKAVV